MKFVFILAIVIISLGTSVEANLIDRIKHRISKIHSNIEMFGSLRKVKEFFLHIWNKIEIVTDEVKKRINREIAEALRVGNEDARLNITQLIQKYRYPVEEHTVNTEDGYLLKVIRIPPKHKNSTVVFLMHGLLDSSDDWVIIGPRRSLAYILHDAGYDVWMGNARGNKHSRRHASMHPEQSEFWQFSWDEIGRFDLPAMVDYALTATRQKDLFYVGHSQGTTSFFVMASMRPEYNDKIRTMFALSPVAWMGNVESPLVRLFAPNTKIIGNVLRKIGVDEFLPSNEILQAAGGFMCEVKAIVKLVCSNALFITSGFNVAQLNATLLPVFLGHFPAGCSTMQFMHYGQGVQSKEFRRFDFERQKNVELYGTVVPPSYDMSMVKTRVALYYSDNDWLAHVDDVKTLRDKLPNVVDFHLISDLRFNHMDFMLAKNAREVVYNRIVTSMHNQN